MSSLSNTLCGLLSTVILSVVLPYILCLQNMNNIYDPKPRRIYGFVLLVLLFHESRPQGQNCIYHDAISLTNNAIADSMRVMGKFHIYI